MLHGPFNFKAHRAPGVKQEKTSSNLRDELITVVMQAGYIFLTYLYIYFACLSVFLLFVCPLVSNKRQIGKTHWAQILFGTSHGTR